MDVKLPKLGEGADSGVVVNVFVKEGDTIALDQTLIELENEKAIASIPSTAAGVVAKMHVKAGDKLAVGQRILSLASGGETPAAASAPTPAAVPARASNRRAPAAAPAPAVFELPQRVAAPVAAPSIRRLARELGIDLSFVHGSEAGGRIAMSDVRTYIERLQRLALSRPQAGAPAAATPKAESMDFSKWGPILKKPVIPLRQTIARRMVENWQSIPHVTQFDEADVTTLNEYRRQFAPAYEAKGARLTVTVFILKALVGTLKKHPIFNASLDEVAQELILKEYFHLGIAVDTEQGLIVPVIRDADKKDLLQLAVELEGVAKKARERKVTGEDLRGGTFTISNQGGIGGAHFTPIINKPEVAILGLGRGALKPVVRDGKIEARMLVPLGLSYDHRVIDGGAAARFITDFVTAVQTFPETAVKL
jgi:pyruvate dehydrogenase E2 component (dihydrolipoamide acetyltransferase)